MPQSQREQERRTEEGRGTRDRNENPNKREKLQQLIGGELNLHSSTEQQQQVPLRLMTHTQVSANPVPNRPATTIKSNCLVVSHTSTIYCTLNHNHSLPTLTTTELMLVAVSMGKLLAEQGKWSGKWSGKS